MNHLPTTQKAVANLILKSGIENDVYGCMYLFMDNRYVVQQLFALTMTNYNVRAIGMYKANRTGFKAEALQLHLKTQREDIKRGWLMKD